MPGMSASGTTWNVLDEGDGPVVLFVHGFPLDHTMWQGQIDALSADHRAIAPDLRGFGGSDVTPGSVSMAQHANDLAAILDQLGVTEPVVFCGLSMGGYVGWDFIRLHRDRLRALVVCDSRAAADSEEARGNRAKMAKSVLANGPEPAVEAMLPKLFADATHTDHPEIVEGLRATMLATDPEGIAASLRGMAERPDATDLLPSIDVPTLLICGEHDAITPPGEMRSVANAIPGSRFEPITGAGHMAPLERPAAVNEVLRNFIADL